MIKQALTLKELQVVYLDILKDLDKFCTKNNITYYMGCGTLIGAVRHKGFIPWDDDVDVFMPFPDYVRFAKEYHSDRYRLHTCNNDLSHAFTFAHLCDSMVYSIKNKQEVYDCGIDVYIMYGAPSNREDQLKHMDNVFKYIKLKHLLTRFRDGLVRRGLWPFKTLDFKMLNNVLKKACKEFEKYKYEDCEYIWPYGGGRLNLRKELYGSPIRMQFEDGLFLAPEHYHEVLTLGYGDYMQLPPKDQRKPYHDGSAFFWK